jgi:hypothetical protein
MIDEVRRRNSETKEQLSIESEQRTNINSGLHEQQLGGKDTSINKYCTHVDLLD